MMAASPSPRQRGAEAPTQRFVFLLLDRFSMLPVAAAIEVLRVANRLLGHDAYAWLLAGEGGETATSSNGTVFRLDTGIGPGEGELDRDDTVLVCGGIDVQKATGRTVINWLRRAERRGAALGAMCTGAHALARAGLLDGHSATIHWENHDGFTEEFPEVRLTKSIYVVDGNRLTAAGGTAAIDLMLALVARDHGEALASSVADQLIYSAIRTDQDSQRLSVPTRIGVRHPKLAEVIRIMEQNTEEPISPARLAAQVGISTRQLERLARRYLSRSPKRYYMELRLQKARNLLMQTDMSVINIALACGFTSPSHFSKCYRAHYGTTPYHERGAQSPRARA